MSRNKGITGKAAIFSQDLSGGIESAAVSLRYPLRGCEHQIPEDSL
jgi:hypothetical protein